MKWTSLEDWRRLDREVKERFARWEPRFRGIPPEHTTVWLTYNVCAALAPPFLLAPLITWKLYPWLPQPDAWIYACVGMALGGVALAARHEYKNRTQSARVVSDSPPQGGEK